MSWIEAGILAYLLIHLIRFFFISFPAMMWPEFVNYFTFFCFIIVFKKLKFSSDSNKWYWAIHLFCMLNILIVGIAFLNVAFSGKAGFNFTEFDSVNSYLKYNTNFLSSVLALQIPFLLHSNRLKEFKNHFTYLLIGISWLIIFLLNSRGVSLTVVLFFVLLAFQSIKLKSFSRYILPMGLLILSSLVVLYSINDQSSFLKTYNYTSSLEGTNSDERVKLWKKSTKLFLESPLVGHGLGSWKIQYLKYGLSDFKFSKDNFKYYTHAHSFFFEAISEAGILGFLFFILMLVFPLVFSFYNNNTLSSHLLFMIMMMSFFYGFIYKFSLIFSIHQVIWAFAISQLRFKKQFHLSNFASIIIVFVLIISCIYTIHIHSIKSKIDFSNLKTNDDFLKRAQLLEKKYHPDFSAYVGVNTIKEKIGQAYWRAQKKGLSIKAYEQGLLDNPYRAYTMFQLGLKQRNLGNQKNALQLFQNALKTNENLNKVRLELIKSYLNASDFANFNKHASYLENELNQQVAWYYSEQVLDSDNEVAIQYIQRKCKQLDDLLSMRFKAQTLVR